MELFYTFDKKEKMKNISFTLLFLATYWMGYSQFQMDCKITTSTYNTNYRMVIGEKASKTIMNQDGMDMIMLNLMESGVYTLMPDQNMAIKLNQNTLDTLEVCSCTFTKTGKKKQILGYYTEEYLQHCKSARGTSDNHVWIAPTLLINPQLITPMKQYISSASTRPSGFPLLMEGVLSDKSTVRFEVLGITPIKLSPNELIVPTHYMVIEN